MIKGSVLTAMQRESDPHNRHLQLGQRSLPPTWSRMSGAGVRLVEVEGEEMKKALMELKEVFVSSYGPWGSLALLQAMPDGVLTLTRCSQKILTLLKTPNPIIKTITSHLQGHTQCYHDSTLYAGILTCK